MTAAGAVAQSPQVQAVKKFRGLVKSGQLSKYYGAAIGIGDASLKDEALKLLKIYQGPPSATADDFVLWDFGRQSLVVLKPCKNLPVSCPAVRF